VRAQLRYRLWFAIAFAMIAGGAAIVLLLRPAPPPQIVILPQPSPPPPTTTAPATPTLPPASVPFDIPLQSASIAQIDARREPTPALFRLDVAPAVLVLDFPDLHSQAQMLNRVAALIEKADMPRDRVVTEAELDSHIRVAGGTPDDYYYGHDYRAADLAHFFQLATAQGLPLNPHETWLRALLDHEGWFKDNAVGALITIPGVSPDIDATSRTTIFRHELSHAVYFTDPAYVALTRHLWNDMLSEPERAAMRGFLGKDGYDIKDEDLMANEGQAYLIHTRDPRYFMPAMIGIDPTREAILRGTFIDAIPEPWLRDSALAVAPITPTAAPPAAAPPPVNAVPWSAPVRPPPPVPLDGADRPGLPAAPR
jgi:hypothetical protein